AFGTQPLEHLVGQRWVYYRRTQGIQQAVGLISVAGYGHVDGIVIGAELEASPQFFEEVLRFAFGEQTVAQERHDPRFTRRIERGPAVDAQLERDLSISGLRQVDNAQTVE